MTAQKIRVMLADDHQMLREGLRALLESQPDMSVVAEAGTGDEAIQLATVAQPDVIVMDLGMPGTSGLEAIRVIRLQGSAARVVVLSMHGGNEIVMQALRSGADGYVMKSSAHTHLLQAIRAVHRGERYLGPAAAAAVIDNLLDDRPESQRLSLLSEREAEVLRWTARGYTSREVGERLALSPKTVDTYRERAMEKLNLKTRADMIRFALRAGLLDSPGN
jgi:two-component system, NarL family, response regulator NreC